MGTRHWPDDASDEVERLEADNKRLREWIRREGEVTDTCTFHVLGEVCQGCECKRKVPNVELTGGALAPSSDRRERG